MSLQNLDKHVHKSAPTLYGACKLLIFMGDSQTAQSTGRSCKKPTACSVSTHVVNSFRPSDPQWPDRIGPSCLVSLRSPPLSRRRDRSQMMQRMSRLHSTGPETAAPTVGSVFQVHAVAFCSIGTASPYPRRLEHRPWKGLAAKADGRVRRASKCPTSGRINIIFRSPLLYMVGGQATTF